MKILVTGPQRSGSTFVSHCIAHDLGIPHFDEGLFNARDYDGFLQVAKENQDWVIHGPAIFHRVLDIQKEFPDVEFVVLRRDIADIVKSQERIGWSDEGERESFNAWDDPRPIAVIKYEFWDTVKHQLSNWREFEYEQFKTHQLWINKEHRSEFHSKQWQLES
jgi:hypothetical protein